MQAINALGRSDKFLKLEIIKKGLGVIALFIGVYFGALVVVAMKVLADFIGIFINAYPNRELLNYDAKMQLKDISKSIVLASLMAVIVFLFGLVIPTSFIKLIILPIVGIISYILLSVLSKNESFYFLVNHFKALRRRNE